MRILAVRNIIEGKQYNLGKVEQNTPTLKGVV